MVDAGSSVSNRPEIIASGKRLLEHGVFEAAVRKTRMAMVIVDPNLLDLPVVYVNAAFTELTGYEPADVLGRNCRFMQGPDTDPRSVTRIRQALADGQPIVEELYNYRRDGSGFWNALYVSPIHDGDGRLEYFFASQADISIHREALRRQVRRGDNVAALVTGVAHQFNNLMTVVLGSVEHAATQVSDKEPRRHLQRASWGATRAGQLAGDLLTLVRREGAEDADIDLVEAIGHLGSEIAAILPPTVRLHLPAGPEPVFLRLSRNQLRRALLAVAQNAVDAMPDGGDITVAMRIVAGSVSGGVDRVELSVEDTGRGMSPQVRERATEVFFTTKAINSGLGLFIVLDFVERSGGWLAIESRPSEGTIVRMTFPRALRE